VLEDEDGHGGAVPLRACREFLVESSSFDSRNGNEHTGARSAVAAGCGREATGVSFAQYRGRIGKSRMVKGIGGGGGTPVVFQRVWK
jgi:hypothetical protein